MTPGAADPPLGTFLATLRRSRLIDPADLDRLAARHDGSARDLTDTLLRNGTLTHYQVDKLLNGRWQGLVAEFCRQLRLLRPHLPLPNRIFLE